MTFSSSSSGQDSPDAKNGLRGITIQRHPESLSRPTLHHLWTYLLTSLVFISSAILFWVFGVTFWILSEAILQALHRGDGHSLTIFLFSHLFNQPGSFGITDGCSVDIAVILALFATWGSLYLFMDHLSLRDNLRLKKQLAAIITEPGNPPGYFVEVRTSDPRLGRIDTGFLFITGDKLLFRGIQTRITIERGILYKEGVVFRRSFAGLGGGAVILSLHDTGEKIQFIGRDTATRLSDTVRDSKELAVALQAYLAENA